MMNGRNAGPDESVAADTNSIANCLASLLHEIEVVAVGINDAETVALAEKYEKQHTERIALLERKLETQEAELSMVEREVGEMNAEFKLAAAGANPGVSAGSAAGGPAGSESVDDVTNENAGLRDEIDGLARARRRADAESTADEKLAALKRRMGK